MKYDFSMANRSKFLFFCLLLMVSWTVFGQVFEPLEIPRESDEMGNFMEIKDKNLTLHNNLNDLDLNTVTLRQMGHQNVASVLQFSTSTAPNLVVVNQEGDYNSSILLQAGKNNAAEISQEGDLNSFFGVHFGDGLVSSILQEGNENVIRQFLHGNDMDFHIIQDGNSNEINQFQNGSGIGYSVEQSGDDMKVTIIQDHVMRW